MKACPLIFSGLVLAACQQPDASSEKVATDKPPIELVDLTWTPDAANRVAKLSAKDPMQYSLPDVRVYDAKQQLIFHKNGLDPSDVDLLTRAIVQAKPISGPTFAETIGDFQGREGQPAASLIPARNVVTVIDYWADWCVPCKALEKRLLEWAAQQPSGSVRLVRAETDLVKLGKARGEKQYKIVSHPDGTISKVEM